VNLEVHSPVKVKIVALIDSGNEYHSVISADFSQQLGYPPGQLEELPSDAVGTAKEGTSMEILGRLPIDLDFSFVEKPIAGRFQTRPKVLRGLAMDLNLSGPFLKAHSMIQDHGRDVLISAKGIEIPMRDRPPAVSFCRAYVLRDVVIPAHGCAEGTVRIPKALPRVSSLFLTKSTRGDGLGVSINHFPRTKSGFITDTTFVNDTNSDILLRSGARLGAVQPSEGEPAATKDWQEELRESLRGEDTVLSSEADVTRALGLLTEFKDVFSLDGDFGHTHLLKHSIHTGDAKPIKCPVRPVNPALTDDLKNQIDEWLKFGVIEPSSSPWSSALLAVRKKNGKTRWCLDFRALNAVTVKDAFPLPLIEDNLARLGRSKIFSAIDGSGAFHVVELDEEARPKTAFATPWGLYQFRRMPFGLCNAPATYSRLVQLALAEVAASECLVYLDDSLVHSGDLEQHLKSLRKVLKAYRRAGLKIQPAKCSWFKSKVDYVGHTVSPQGISPMASYVDLVRGWPIPKTIKDVRVFLGKTGYYRRFIEGYSALSAPLTDLLKGGDAAATGQATVELSEEARQAFHRLKAALTSAPVLAFPRFEAKHRFIVDTDWSYDNNAIGGVLLQIQDGEERTIAFGGKKLLPSQRNYSPTKGELFAIIYFLRYWRYYLQWKEFTLRTDHRALTWIKTMEAPEGMIGRWLETLASFNFDVQYREGPKHGNADGLSRAPHLPPLEAEEEIDEGIIGALHDLEDDQCMLPKTDDEWAEAQDLEPEMRNLKALVLRPEPLNDLELRKLDPRTRQLYKLRTRLVMDNGVLCYSCDADQRIVVVPRHLEDEAAREAHELVGHRGLEATYAVLSTRALILSGRAVIRRVIDQCLPCQKKLDPGSGQREHFVNVPTSYPFQRISIDYVGPLTPTRRGNLYVFTAKCPFTKWVEAFPTADATAESAADALVTHIFPRFGFCDELHSDRATAFMGNLISELCRMFRITATQTPAYHPQSNPVERAHRDLKAGLRAALEAHPGKDWDELLPQILFAFRVSPARGIGMSPFELLFGRLPNIPLGALQAPPNRRTAILPYVENLKDKIRKANDWARTHLAEEVSRQQREYRGKRYIFRPGELVWLSDLTGTARGEAKLRRPWTGPWVVKSLPSPVLVKIARDGVADDRVYTVAADRLIPYYRSKKGRTGEREPSPAPDVVLAGPDVDHSIAIRSGNDSERGRNEDDDVEDDDAADLATEDDAAADPGGGSREASPAPASSSASSPRDAPPQVPPTAAPSLEETGTEDRRPRVDTPPPTPADAGHGHRGRGRPPDPELRQDPTFRPGPAAPSRERESRPRRAAAEEALRKTRVMLRSCERLRDSLRKRAESQKRTAGRKELG